MKKENVYVPIANKKEAKRAKAVLEAMGEKIFHMFMPMDDKDIYLLFEDDCWLVGCKAYERKEITLKQLIELLVSEQKEPEKIAVRVDNEKEFNALMKYYDSLGWKWASGDNPVEIKYNSHIHTIRFENFFGHASDNFHEIEGYKIIPFSEFAKEHGIRVPIGVTHDGVDIYKGDVLCCVNIHHNRLGNDRYVASSSSEVEPTSHYYFSTKKAALDWIEAQKPKKIEYTSEFGIKCQVTKEETLLTCNCGCFSITKKDIKAIHKAMEELNK